MQHLNENTNIVMINFRSLSMIKGSIEWITSKSPNDGFELYKNLLDLREILFTIILYLGNLFGSVIVTFYIFHGHFENLIFKNTPKLFRI